MNIRLILVDLNGTLVDDWEASYAGVVSIFDAYDVPDPSMDVYIRHVVQEGDYLDFFRHHGVRGDSRNELYNHFIPGYRAALDYVLVTRFGVSTLRALRYTFKMEIDLLTSARGDFAEMIIGHFSLDTYYDRQHHHVFNKEALIRVVAEARGYKPQECLMIGDTPSDILHTQAAGIHALGLRNTYVPADVFSEDMYECLVDDFSDLITFTTYVDT